VIHAVGPDYSRWDPDIPNVDETGQTTHPFHEPDLLLKSTFSNSLHIAKETGISELAFALISAGDNSGERSLEDMLSVSIDGICEWVEDNIPLSTTHTIQ
jgi:O-acetyl-ADP-ribose deacetylase (regulator of RNase III)